MMTNNDSELSYRNNEFCTGENSNAAAKSEALSSYREMYHLAFNAISDAMKKMQEVNDDLRNAQLFCENIYMDIGNPQDILTPAEMKHHPYNDNINGK